jgi:hypothetical protein
MTDGQRQSRREIAEEGDEILRRARCNTMTGQMKDRKYRRDKRAERKISMRHWREKKARLGTLGAASPVRSVKVTS